MGIGLLSVGISSFGQVVERLNCSARERLARSQRGRSGLSTNAQKPNARQVKVIDRLQGQSTQHRAVRVGLGGTAPTALLLVAPALQSGFIYPKGQRTPRFQGRVILFPVADAILPFVLLLIRGAQALW